MSVSRWIGADITRYRGVPEAVFTDVDGTLTTSGRIEAVTYAALERLAAHVPVIVVTGRPAGWAQAFVETWPVTAVVAENGAVLFCPRRRYLLAEECMDAHRSRMQDAVRAVQATFPSANLSEDSAYRDVDLAFDWNEHRHLSIDDADSIVEIVRARGLAASRSSVHVNFGPADIDKLTACRVVVTEVLHGDLDRLAPYLYIGDSLNDAPMFGGFTNTMGVANVRDVWDVLPHRPAYVTQAREGAGFREVVDELCARWERSL